ncbi:MAG TPA: NUDIX hydrolase [Candidatus Saccharimonadales bacterium]|nr:NUDIX hydrolase [Candidatus Saccharimonadales bacterium]
MALHEGKMRGLSVALIKQGNKVLVSPGHDDVKGIDFYRLLGGGIEFGETSLEALKREIKEELNAELENIRLLEVVENIFIYNNQAGHEIAFIYAAEFADKTLYQKEIFDIEDGGEEFQAIWLEINESNIDKIFPGNFKNLLLV